MTVTTARLTEPTTAQLTEVAGVFDQYRAHYGEPVLPGQTLAWLADQVRDERLAIFTAHSDGELAGLATTASLPASLRLSRAWQLRDLYVIPGARRRGVARALLESVRAAAGQAGAIRLSVQTEPGNTAAIRLYRTSGFRPVEDLQILALPLQQDAPDP